MAASKYVTLAKYILVFTGIIYLISAGGLSYIGIWVFSTYDHYDEIADAYLTLLPASIILAISAVMCIIGILACLAACKRSKPLLSVFFCLILMVLLGELSVGVLGFVYRSKVEGVLKEDLMDAMNSYNLTVYQEQIDYMQEEFSCCGVHNASDWLSSTYWKQNHSDTVPASCCKTNQTCIPTLGSQNIYYEGCLNKLDDEFNQNLVYVIAAAVFLALVQLLALLSACILVCRSTEERRYQTLAEQPSPGWRV